MKYILLLPVVAATCFGNSKHRHSSCLPAYWLKKVALHLKAKK